MNVEVTQQPPISQLRWRCRRGMLELDILLNTFLDKEYAALSAEQTNLFITLLDYPDQTLYELLMGKMQACDMNMARLITTIRQIPSQE